MAYKGTAIVGGPSARVAQMQSFVTQINPTAPQIAALYLSIGPRLGIRGDLAYAQAIHETNYFRYGGLVKPEQNNYAGIGATGPGNPGASFATPEEGVLAHAQHLFAYASTDPLPDGMPKVDPRFDLVQRGVAPYVGDLNGRWAVPGTTYGQSIDRILGAILTEPNADEPYAITRAYLGPTSQNRPGPCDGSACWDGVKGIVVHRTASPTADAPTIQRYFNNAPDGRFASSQFILDNNVILQAMPIGEIAFHTSGKNLTHLGIETCEHNWGTDTWPETYRKLVWLTAYLVRMFQLDIKAVTGHFWWDKVNRPYDPTYMGWSLADGKAKGIFDWNQFIVDVQAQVAQPAVDQPMAVEIDVRQMVTQECTTGIIYNSMTYVPIRSYTACVVPDASIEWDPNGPKVIVELPEVRSSAAGPSDAAPTATAADATSNPAVPSPETPASFWTWLRDIFTRR